MALLKEKYDAKSILVLEGLEAIRKRPGMYIGSTDQKGLNHLAWEIIDNSIDEAQAGYCTEINVTINKDNSLTVKDNGRGIPVGIHHKTKISTIETVFTKLHAGGKFNNKSYKISGGLHGVGAAVVNALSSFVKITVFRNQNKYTMKFINGGHISQSIQEEPSFKKETGTIITFLPDHKIFSNLVFSSEDIKTKLQQIAFLNKNLKIIFKNLNTEKEAIIYHYKEGISNYVDEIKSKKNDFISKKINLYGEGVINNNNLEFEISLAYTNSFYVSMYSFCNSIFNEEGGKHVDGFKRGLLKAFNHFYKHDVFKQKIALSTITWDDVKEGLIAIISVKHSNPQYTGQTKTKLSNSEVLMFIANNVYETITSFLLKNPAQVKIIFQKIALSQKGRIASEKAKIKVQKSNSLLAKFNLPGKLADCHSRDNTKTELFIVEGDSAGGSAKAGREREFQAILPIKGKLLNAKRSTYQKIHQNKEIISIAKAIGINLEKYKKDKIFKSDFNKIRYNKIIIMTDADVDGSHIKILLLTLFYYYMRDLIERGHIFIAIPPLYKITITKNNYFYCYSDQELNLYRKENPKAKFSIQRYKGLGEMNPQQLWETTMNPQKRKMLKIKVKEPLKIDNLIDILMGYQPLERKEYIKNHATSFNSISW